MIVATHKAGREETASLQVITDDYVIVAEFTIEH